MSKKGNFTPLKKVTDQHRLFARLYVATESNTGFNGMKAAIEAGYSERNAKQQAYKLLQDPLIQVLVSEALAERIERVDIDADYVLKRMVEIDQMDVIDIMDDDGSLKAIGKWPKIWRQFISGLDVTELTRDGMTYGLLKKIKWPDKVKNLELLGKHINVQAFSEKLEIKNTDELEEKTDEELDAEIRRRLSSANSAK